MKRFVVWLFWRIVYLFRRRPRDFGMFMAMQTRCWWPWKKFRPSVWRNEDGKKWQIWLSNDSGYSHRERLEVEVTRSFEMGKIVGLTLWDENLKASEIAEKCQ